MPRIMIKGGVWRNTEVRLLAFSKSFFGQRLITAKLLLDQAGIETANEMLKTR